MPDRPRRDSPPPPARARRIDPPDVADRRVAAPPPARPARPPVAVTAMREPVSDDRPRIIAAGVGLWLVAIVALAATAALVGSRQSAVRGALRASLAREHPTTSPGDISRAVDIAVVASGALSVVIVLLVLWGVLRLRDRIIGGRGVLTTCGVLTAAAAIGFWTVLGPARDEVDPAANVLPFVVAGAAAAATAVMFAPAITRWLRAAPLR